MAHYTDVRKAHALETLAIVVRCILTKNFTGWEVMEVLAGGVSQSDDIFMAFTALVNDILADEQAPASIRHLALQGALIYMCAVGQLSPGAYFLRRDLFPSIATVCSAAQFASVNPHGRLCSLVHQVSSHGSVHV